MMTKDYTYVGGEAPFKCNKCGRLFSSEGGYNLHGPCGPGYRSGRNQKGNKKEGSGGCDHDFRLLDTSKKEEKLACDAGYSEVCTKCEDLR